MSKIQKTKRNFDLSTEGMIALSKAGASSRLIQLLLRKRGARQEI